MRRSHRRAVTLSFTTCSQTGGHCVVGISSQTDMDARRPAMLLQAVLNGELTRARFTRPRMPRLSIIDSQKQTRYLLNALLQVGLSTETLRGVS